MPAAPANPLLAISNIPVFARLGVSLAVVSLLALALAGIAWAAGASVSGACGGG
jgi:hypothetical protein